MITGIHAIVFSTNAAKVRAFFADVLKMPAADAGGGGSYSRCRLPSWLSIRLMVTAVISFT